MRVYTGLGRVSLRPVRALALLHSKFAVGVTNGRERECASQVSGETSECVWLVDRLVSGPLCMGCPLSLYSPGRTGGSDTKGMEK